jgi:Exonuclease VII, large subunit
MDQPDTPGPPPASLTPSAFLEAMAARINKLHEADAAPVVLHGVPLKKYRSDRVYGGFVYAQVRDPRTADVLDARVPEALVGRLPWGKEAVLAGLVRYRVSRGEAKPEFRIDDVLHVGPRHLSTEEELAERWSQVIARPRRDVRAALQAERPRVALVTGVGSVVVEDIRAQLGEMQDRLELKVVRVSLAQPEEVAKAIREPGDVHLVVLTRGGGPDVLELDRDEVIAAVASCPVPVVVALGHAIDRPVLERVADLSFPTPTAFGAWLRAELERKEARAREVEQIRQVERQPGVLGELEALRRANEEVAQAVAQLRQAQAEELARVLGSNEGLAREVEGLREQLQRADAARGRWLAVTAALAGALLLALAGLLVALVGGRGTP